MLLEPDHVITGMARGWDTAIGAAAYLLGIPFTAAVPFAGQEERWPEDDQRMYREIIAEAAHVETLYPRYGGDVYRWRDEWMVDRGDMVLALYNGDIRSGTGMTVRYANRKSVPVLNLWAAYQRVLSRPRPRDGLI